MKLEPGQEIVGILRAVKEEDNCCKLKFTCLREIEIPPTAASHGQLKAVLGKRVGILNIDGDFFIRKIKTG